MKKNILDRILIPGMVVFVLLSGELLFYKAECRVYVGRIRRKRRIRLYAWLLDALVTKLEVRP
ncbi:hypothetical protein Holit_01500 [Hollandina sp. SP2]